MVYLTIMTIQIKRVYEFSFSNENRFRWRHLAEEYFCLYRGLILLGKPVSNHAYNIRNFK